MAICKEPIIQLCDKKDLFKSVSQLIQICETIYLKCVHGGVYRLRFWTRPCIPHIKLIRVAGVGEQGGSLYIQMIGMIVVFFRSCNRRFGNF